MSLILPRIIAVLIAAVGVLNILSSFFVHFPDRFTLIHQFLPVIIIHASHTLTLLIGFLLLVVARGIWQRKERAWYLAVALICLSLVFHLLRGFHIEEAILLLIPLAVLLAFRSLFTVKSGTWEVIKGVKFSLIVMAVLFIYAVFGFYIFQGQFSKTVSLQTIIGDYMYAILGIGEEQLIPTTHLAQWFEDSIAVVGISAVILSFGSIFIPVFISKTATEEQRKKVRDLIKRYGASSLSYYALMSDKSYFFSSKTEGVVVYKVENGVAVVLGDPIVRTEDMSILVDEFETYVTVHGLQAAYYSCTEQCKEYFDDKKYRSIKIGEEAVINLATFTTQGSAMDDVRYGINRMKRMSAQFSWYPLDEVPWRVLNEVDVLYKEWIAEKKAPELTFSMDFYPFPVEHDAWLLTVAGPEGNLWGAYTYYPYNQGRGMVLDFMLRSVTSPSGMVEGALAESIEHFRNAGKVELSLSNAPLSNTQKAVEASLTDKGVKLIFNNVNRFYNYRSLFTFKQKFLPKWEPRYLVFRSYVSLPQVAYALIQVHMKEKGLPNIVFKTVFS